MTDTDAPRRQRALQFARSVLGNAITRPLSLVCMLVQTPLALNMLSSEGFGFWLALTAAFNTFMIFDFGLSFAMQNRVSKCLGTGNMEEMRSAFLQTTCWLSAISGALLLLLIPAILLTGWASVFRLSNPAIVSQAPACVMTAAISLCVNLPLAAAQRLAIGLQLSWLASLAALAASVLSLALVVVATLLKIPLAWFVMLSFLPFILSNTILLMFLFHRLNWSWRAPAPLPHKKELLKSSALFLLPQLGATLIFTAPPAMIALLAGADTVTPFTLGLRITSLLSQTGGLLLAPLWPAYAEAFARQDFTWIRNVYYRSLFLTILCAGICSFLIALFGRKLIILWTSNYHNIPTPTLMWLLATWTFLSCIGQASACLLNGLGQLRGQATYGFISALVATLLIVVFVPVWGPTGAAAALLIGYALINCPGFSLEIMRLLKTLPSPTPEKIKF